MRHSRCGLWLWTLGQRFRQWPRVRLVGCLIIALVGMMSVARIARNTQMSGRDPLAVSLGSVRLFEARLTGGYAYGPLPAGTDDRPSRLEFAPEVVRSLAHAEQTAREGSPAGQRALAVSLLVQGRFDVAIETLVRFLQRNGSQPSVWSDLSAAYLSRGRPEDAVAALDAADRALAADSALAEARFNQGLALTRLSLVRDAQIAWTDYLRLDPSSGWASEARAHLQKVARLGRPEAWQRHRTALLSAPTSVDIPQVVRDFPQEAREFLADDLLGLWAARALDDYSAGAVSDDTGSGVDGGVGSGTDVARLLATASELGNALAVRGEHLPSNGIRALSFAKRGAHQRLARGHVAYGRARIAYEAYRLAEALPLMTESANAFGADSPFGLWARLHIAVIAYQNGAIPEAVRSLAALRQSARAERSPALLARVDWVQSVIDSGRGAFTEALAAQQRSLMLFEGLGEIEHIATLHSLVGETLRLLGDPRQSWAHQMKALGHLPSVRRPARRQTIVLTAALASLRLEYPAAALHFDQEFLRAAEETKSATAVAEAYLHRARAHLRLPDKAAAAADLERAKQQLERATEAGVAAFVSAQLQMVEAEQWADSDPRRARVLLDGAIAYFVVGRRDMWLPRAYLARGRLFTRLGEWESAQRDFQSGIDVFEEQLHELAGPATRVSYQDEIWHLFDEMISLQIDRERPDAAFALAERARARSLWSQLDAAQQPAAERQADTRPSSGSVQLADLARALPDRATMVYYVATARAMHAWVIARGSADFVALPDASPATVAADAAAFRRALEHGSREDARNVAVRLGRAIIAPLDRALEDASLLVIVADGPLHQLPFAALPVTSRGDPLITRFPIVMAPSARLYMRALTARTAASTSVPPAVPALIVANPARGQNNDGVSALPAAEAEARDLMSVYRGADLLVGHEATRSRVLALLRERPVVHLATHALVNHEFPELSRFLFAPDVGNVRMSTVLARDLAAQRFDRTQLVVLAACETAAGPTMKGEGVMSLARPFLAGGVPSVVATLWPIDDRVARALFTRFHRSYRRGIPPADALREAQLALLQDEALPFGGWAAAIVIGR